MKKLLLLITVICGACMFGCVSTTASNTYKTVGFGNHTESKMITADLVVSEQRVRGEASGYFFNYWHLKREAIANALGQNPLTAETPDILMAKEEYTERTGLQLRVVVSGYPAWYRNIRNAPEFEYDPAYLIITNQNAVGAEAR